MEAKLSPFLALPWAFIAHPGGGAIICPASLIANLLPANKLPTTREKARTECRLLSERGESRVQHRRKVSGNRTEKAAVET